MAISGCSAAAEEEFWKANEARYAADTNAREIKRLAGRFIRGQVLDIGAGSGALIDMIPHAVGLDLAPKHPRIRKGDVSSLPFEDGRFETVFATEVLEHLNDETLVRGLSEISRVLKPGGHLVVTVPFQEDLRQETVSCPSCGFRFHRWGHVRVFDCTELKGTLTKAGFTVICSQTVPLDFMARHRFLRHFWRLFRLMGYFGLLRIFAVARKND